MPRAKKKYGGKFSVVDWFLIYAVPFYTVIPHSVHQALAPDWILVNLGFLQQGFSHEVHVFIGVGALIVLGLKGTLTKIVRKFFKK